MTCVPMQPGHWEKLVMPGLIEPLKKLLQDPKEDVRTEAEVALVSLGVKKNS